MKIKKKNVSTEEKSIHRPIGAEPEGMVVIEGLLMEVVSIIIQHPSNPVYPVVKDEFQFRLLNLTQKFMNAREKILWPRGTVVLPMPPSCIRKTKNQKPELRRCEVRTVR
jgi:hypothetical protein